MVSHRRYFFINMDYKIEAEKIIDSYRPLVKNCECYFSEDSLEDAKKCARTAVDKIMETIGSMKSIFSDKEIVLRYLKDVRDEIEQYQL